ncbi:hypothetical protein ID852_10275 [Xenorhabdus sp. 42]|uniref:hypothetical protein n=1 Tax=Xenorhabdus szentirmaii TaxID=290112 RepID=UPI0019AD8AF1|nr:MULTISPECIES: hypothetical protein [unclassified Xenorhabdus]MBD2791170.1 hypothetical protein [Xenorhabdus sp. CUL]MBD2821075.1 hypothetical protein [Xenorhabdus sp. 42]MBD2824216.1 hypothetical protein [Xenorhabdus sp. 5]
MTSAIFVLPALPLNDYEEIIGTEIRSLIAMYTYKLNERLSIVIAVLVIYIANLGK